MKHFYHGKKVLVTGGAGFIGSHLVDALLKEKAQVTVLDDLSTGQRENLPKASHGFTFMQGSILDKKLLATMPSCNIIFHLAGRSSVSASCSNPFDFFEVNVQGTRNILELARIHRIDHVLFASSAAIYGNYEKKCFETLAGDPCSLYGHSKYLAEGWCNWYCLHHDVPVSSLRFFNVYGDRQRADIPGASLLAKAKQLATSTDRLTVFGNGSQMRDFVPVETVVKALLCVGSKKRIRALNIATGNSISVMQALQELVGILPERLMFGPAKKGDILYSHAETRLLREVLQAEHE